MSNRNTPRLAKVVPLVLLAGCASAPEPAGNYHLLDRPASLVGADAAQTSIPQPVRAPMTPPPPRNGPALETYSVVVSQVEIADLLFAMARDAKINVDVHPAVRGRVTLNAIEQTLPQILNRLSRQVSLRYEFDGDNLVILPDAPFIRHYPIDYVNIARSASASTSIATQISSTGGAGGGGGEANNNSTTRIVNQSNNQFWDTLVANVRTLVGVTAATGGENSGSGSSGGTSSGAGSGVTGSGGSGGGSSGGGSSGGSSSGGAATGGTASGGGSSGGGASSSPTSGGAQSTSGGNTGAAPANGMPGELPKAVIANRETGMITVRANMHDHERVREYIDKVMGSARRQVLIEATIAEVQLSESYQQGINWQKIRLDGSGWSFVQQPGGTNPLSTGIAPGSGPAGIYFPNSTNGNLPGGAVASGAETPSLGVMRYLRSSSSGDLGAALSLLQSFGKVKVLSSPKISVLNNQTAVLKVVDNRIYFTIEVQVTPGTDTSAPLVTYTSTPNTVPVGFVMSVTPQIEDTGMVTMNVRPTISRIIGFVNDPSPALAQNNVVSRVPEIQTREIESIMKVATGDVAVMGGLMQETVDDRTDAVPGAANVPFFGELFRYRNDNAQKSELVIFLRPIVLKDASMEGDFRHLKPLQPKEDFFRTPDRLPLPRHWRQPSDERASKDKESASTDKVIEVAGQPKNPEAGR
ncbi:MAG: pilus (MSHA type) biogenesis protein MshL [Burkholderiaceae bacterium]